MSLFWTILIAVALGVTVGRWAIQFLLALVATSAVSGAEAAARWPEWKKSDAGRTRLRKIERGLVWLAFGLVAAALVAAAISYQNYRAEEARKARAAQAWWDRVEACTKAYPTRGRDWCYSNNWRFEPATKP